MNNKSVELLEAHESETPSRFASNAAMRLENESWLRWSKQVALSLIDYMETNGLKRTEHAERLNVSPQYVSRLLSGRENLSLKSVANINDRLGINSFSKLK